MGNLSSQSKYRIFDHKQKKLFIAGFAQKVCKKTFPYDVISLLSKWIDDTITITFNKKSLNNINNLMLKNDNYTNTDEFKYNIEYSNLISVEISILLTENDSFIGLEFRFNKLLSTISWLSCYADIKCIETNSQQKLTKKIQFNKYNNALCRPYIDKYYNIIPLSQYKQNQKQLTFEMYIEFARIGFNDDTMKYLIPSPVMSRNIFYEWVINFGNKETLKSDDTLHLSENFCNDCMTCYFEPYTSRFGIRIFKLPLNVKYITANVLFELKDDINSKCMDTYNCKSRIIIFGDHVHWQYFDMRKYMQFIKEKLVFNVYVDITKVFDENQQINESNWEKYGIVGNGMVSKNKKEIHNEFYQNYEDAK